MTKNDEPKGGILVSIVKTFLTGQASILLILFALFVGAGAVLLTPREEEPQIVVPMADVIVRYPGASAKEVEKLAASKLEKLLWQIDGVEYVYSTSYDDMAVVTVRYYVKEDRERSLIKLYNQMQSHVDEVVPGITGWIVKPVEIDDVPIVTFHLYSKTLDALTVRRVAEETGVRLAETEDNSRITVTGGQSREIRVELDSEKLVRNDLSPLEVLKSVSAADVSVNAGSLERENQSFSVRSGPFLRSKEEVEELVIAARNGRLIRLGEVSRVLDTGEEPSHYTRFGFGAAGKSPEGYLVGESYPSAVIAVSKKKGTNAVFVADDVIQRMQSFSEDLFPSGIEMQVTRNYGETANIKVNELLSSLFFAILGVVTLIALTMGWREALVVALAVPISFSLSLFVNYVSGYTINRVTLFALILSLGLVVDDPITNVDNIQRHIFSRKRNPFAATLLAVKEVLPPVIMSTLAIIVSFLPMFFITGMMGPYMEPMAINVPLTVTFSTLCALTFVPWAAHGLLKNSNPDAESKEDEDSSRSGVAKLYRAVLAPLLDSGFRRGLLFVMTFALLGVSGLLVVFKKVPLKMLPFDNKNEFQVIVNMPEGTSLESTDAVIREMEKYLAKTNEVSNFQSYSGVASPMDFNGMVRHYYMRKGPNMGDIRVNLLPKDNRVEQSHNIVLRLRGGLNKIADAHGAKIEVVEVPPGPPVLATVVAELYGEEDTPYEDLAESAAVVEQSMLAIQGLEDVDSTVEDSHTRIDFNVNREKAALHGVALEQINQALMLALSGIALASLHTDSERNRLAIRLVLPPEARSELSNLENLRVRSKSGSLVPLAELGEFVKINASQPVYHKNLKPVVYVTGEMVGRAPGEAILELMDVFSRTPLKKGVRIDWAGEGEWKITLDVFRDLGIAFGAAMIGIYFLIVLETSSFFLPVLIMLAIPLTAIGIMPGFYILNLIVDHPINGYPTPVFFTATGMIGMIALGGIVVRNSIVLIEFIQDSLKQGMDFKEAILRSGAVRFRPIMLTAGTTMLGAYPITLDPIFSGLAWSLIFGLFASTLFTLIIVPVVYYMIYKKTFTKEA